MSDVALRFGASDDGLTAQFRKVDRQLDALQASTGKVAGAISRGFASIGPIVAGISFAALIKQSIELAETLEKASAQTGIAVENLQRLQFVAEQSNVSFESVTGAVNRLQKALTLSGEGSKEATDALSRLGIPINEFVSLAPDEQFLKVAQAISSITDPAEQTTAAIALFGRGGADLLPILKQGSAELAELSVRFDTLGITISGETTKQVDDLGDSFGLLADSTKKVGVELLALIAPPVIAGFEALALTIKSFRFALAGGDNEIVRISDQIDKLRGQAVAFQNALNPEGRRRFGELSAEIARLQAQLDTLTETGSFVAPRLETIAIDPAAVAAPNIRFPTGPAGPTPAERRLQGGETSFLNERGAFIPDYTPVEVAQQAHLDEMLRQVTENANERFTIESDFQGLLALSREQFGLQEINWEQIKSQSIFEIAGGLFSSLASQNEKFAKVQQGIALAQAVWYTASGVANALRSVPFPANIAAAAKVAAVGAIQIAKIRSTSFSNGGGAASGGIAVGGAGSAQATLPDTQPATGADTKATTNIYITGPIAGPRSAEWIVDTLRNELNRDVTFFGGNSRQGIDLSPA